MTVKCATASPKLFPPMRPVIFYEQNGEIIGNLQKIGRIHSGVDLFARTGDTNVTFELLNE